MARPGISYEDVKTAAVELLAAGAKPSIQQVRKYLGTGSNSTIGRHLKRWQMEKDLFNHADVPADVPDSVTQALQQFWLVAIEQAEQHYKNSPNNPELADSAELNQQRTILRQLIETEYRTLAEAEIRLLSNALKVSNNCWKKPELSIKNSCNIGKHYLMTTA